MDLVTTMVEYHLRLLGQMIDRAGSLTDEQLDEPIELSVEGIDADPTIRSLLSLLIGQNRSVANRPYDFDLEREECLDSMRRRLAEHGAAFLVRLTDVMAEGRIEETFVDATSPSPRVFTYGAMIAHVLTYAAHRRTLVTGALASAGHGLEDDPLVWQPLEA